VERLKRLLVAAAVAVAVSVVAAGPAEAAKGGNNDTAKACQKGGWKALVPVAGGTFANQGDCVNDGAQGSPPLGGVGQSAGQGACQQIGGSFHQSRPPTWTCEYTPNPPPDPPGDANSQALKTACDTDGGGFNPSSNPTPSNPSAWLVICFI
jgi:hypothetical protein